MFLLERFSVLRYLEEEYTIFCKQDLGTVLTSKLICCSKSCEVRIGLIVPTNRRNDGFLFSELWHTFETGSLMNIDFPGSVISLGLRKTPAFWIIQSIRGLKSVKLSSGTGCHVVQYSDNKLSSVTSQNTIILTLNIMRTSKYQNTVTKPNGLLQWNFNRKYEMLCLGCPLCGAESFLRSWHYLINRINNFIRKCNNILIHHMRKNYIKSTNFIPYPHKKFSRTTTKLPNSRTQLFWTPNYFIN